MYIKYIKFQSCYEVYICITVGLYEIMAIDDIKYKNLSDPENYFFSLYDVYFKMVTLKSVVSSMKYRKNITLNTESLKRGTKRIWYLSVQNQ